MTRHPLPYLVIALLMILSGLATPREAPVPSGPRPVVVASATSERMPLGAPPSVSPLRQGTVTASPAGFGGAPIPSGAVTSAFGDAASVTVQGILGYADASYGPDYLAIPERRGTVVRICGPAACLERVSSDFGPDQRVHPGRIADVAEVDFPVLCGVSQSRGTCPGSYTITRGGPRLTAPPTDGGQP